MEFSLTPYVDPEPGALVERFSWEIETTTRTDHDNEEFEQLRISLIEERNRRAKPRQDELRRIEEHFSSTRRDDEGVFRKTYQDLLEAMKEFQQMVPGQSGPSQLPRSWEDVELVVEDVQSQWNAKKETHLGRAKGWLRKMCDGLNNHSTALKLLPSESVYTSLIAGSVSMVIKASANHISITEAFAQGVIAINDAANMVQKSQIYSTPAIQQLAMRLYTQIFTYLTKFMKWYTDRSRTRFLRSFNENIARTFQSDLDRVREIAGLLCQQIQLHMSKDVRASKLLSEEIDGDLKYLIMLHESSERQSRLREQAHAQLLQSMLHSQFMEGRKELLENLTSELNSMITQMVSGAGITNLLTQQAERGRSVTPELSRDNSTLTSGSSLESIFGNVSPNVPPTPQNGQQIMFDSRHFEDYFSWERVYPFPGPLPPMLADTSFVTRLKAFTEPMKSGILYAHSRFQGMGPNYLQISIATYISLAREAGVPVVSYFAELSPDEPPQNRTKESMELCALLYAMIRQLINLLPPELAQDAARFDAERLSGVEGTLRTWDQALSIFRDLVYSVNLPLILLVIDGLNLLEDDFYGTTDGKVDKLVNGVKDVIRWCKTENCVVKVVFTTAGLSGSLCQQLDERDVVACDPLSPGSGFRRSREMITF